MVKNNNKIVKKFKKTLKKIIDKFISKRGNVPMWGDYGKKYYSLSCVGYRINIYYHGEIELEYYNSGSKYVIHNKYINDFNFYDYINEQLDKKFENEFNLMDDFCNKYKKA